MKAIILLCIFLMSCSHFSQSGADSKFYSLLDAHWSQLMEDHPEAGTWSNYKDGLYNDRWSDNTLASIELFQVKTKKKLEEVKEIDRSDLSDKAKLDYDLYTKSLEHRIAGFIFPGEFKRIDQLGGFHLRVPGMLSRMPKRTLKDYENILSRLNKVPSLISNEIILLKKGLELGVTPAYVTLRDVSNQFDSILVKDVNKNPMTKAFTQFPKTFSEVQKKELVKKAQEELKKAIHSFAQAKKYVVEEYIPHCRKSIAITSLPNGVEWYQHEIKGHITTDQTAEEIHEIGLSEVSRIKKEMNGIISKLKYKGSFKSFLRYLRTDPKFFFTKKEDLLMTYRDIAKRADYKLYEVFNTLPVTPYGVEPTPAYMEKSAPTAYYYGGSHSAGRPGTYYANTYDLKSRPKWEMVALTLHEAVPGHHHQIAISDELGELPEFRKNAHYTAFIEGWGLYAESLGEEMGMYENPYDKFGQLSYEMWRAIRLVIDTGMHAKGWSRAQAINFFKENSPKSIHDITVEVDRYITWPGQALSYKIGELKFKELRKRASNKLGAKFDLREYHNQALKNGALPLSVLESNIDQWLESQI